MIKNLNKIKIKKLIDFLNMKRKFKIKMENKNKFDLTNNHNQLNKEVEQLLFQAAMEIFMQKELIEEEAK